MSAPDFRDVILTIAKTRPGMHVSTAVDLADAIANATPGDLDDAQRLGQWAKRQPEVAQYLSQMGDSGSNAPKIFAIKELRALTHCSLLQAKNAIERVTA